MYISSEINECDSNPCQNGGTCGDGIASFSCSCPTGYEGDQCQMGKIKDVTYLPKIYNYFHSSACNFNMLLFNSEINECDSNQCQNGGTCEDGIASFTCQCLQGYMGVTCDTSKLFL